MFLYLIKAVISPKVKISIYRARLLASWGTLVRLTKSSIGWCWNSHAIFSSASCNVGILAKAFRSCNLTTCSHIHTQPAALPTFGMIMPISGRSSLEFENKRQRRDYFQLVHSILVDGPVKKTQWSHLPIVFSEENVDLLSFPPHRCTGHWRQHTRLDHRKNPGRHGKLCRYNLFKHLWPHEHRPQPPAASGCPAHRLRGQTCKCPRKDNSSSILRGSLKPKDRTCYLRCRGNELPL